MKTATDEDAVFGWQNRHLRKIAFLKGRPQSHSLGGPRALLPSSFVMNEFPGVAQSCRDCARGQVEMLVRGAISRRRGIHD